MKIHCGNCRKELQDDDQVVLDWINSLYHQKCYQLDLNFMKDKDTYRNIKKNYWFFSDAPTKNYYHE